MEISQGVAIGAWHIAVSCYIVSHSVDYAGGDSRKIWVLIFAVKNRMEIRLGVAVGAWHVALCHTLLFTTFGRQLLIFAVKNCTEISLGVAIGA